MHFVIHVIIVMLPENLKGQGQVFNLCFEDSRDTTAFAVFLRVCLLSI